MKSLKMFSTLSVKPFKAHNTPSKLSMEGKKTSVSFGLNATSAKVLNFPNETDNKFMREAIEISKEAVESNIGGPIGAVIVKDGKVIGRGYSPGPRVKDPTAHAEILAIREAAKNLNSNNLGKATLYTSLQPCPMCLAASYWANIGKICYVNTSEDVEGVFNDAYIKRDMAKPISEMDMPLIEMRSLRQEAQKPLNDWIDARQRKRKFNVIG